MKWKKAYQKESESMIWKLQFPITKKSTWKMSPGERLRRRKVDAFLEWVKLIPIRIPKDMNIILDHFEEFEKADSYSEYIQFSAGYNPKLREEVKRYMCRLGWHLAEEDLEKGSDSLTFEHWSENMQIRFSFHHWNSGSTCKRIKIGTETIERDVYDVVCNEAAEEMGV